VNSAPSDVNGAVGATQYVQWVNQSFAVFNKTTGAVVYGPAAGNTLWAGFGGACQTDNDGDIIAQYDKSANRWVMAQFSLTSGPGFFECFAISQTSDATGIYNRYAFPFSNFPDYPKISVWPDAYYGSFNMFNSAGTKFLGAEACAFDRADMLTGVAAKPAQCFPKPASVASLLPSDLDGANAPPAGSPAYFLNIPNTTTASTLGLWKFHADWSIPANSTFIGPTTISVATFTHTCAATGTCIPQPGTSTLLDSLGDRLMYRLSYRNFGDHESLVVNHSVSANSASGIRWYEVRSPGGTPTIFQSGTYAPNDGNWRWMGSMGMDAVGDIGVGYSESGTSLHPSVVYTGRVPSDPAGTLQTETTLFAGPGSQTADIFGRQLTRWGDYSGMSIDPVDDCTFWYTNQYIPADGTFNWATRIGSFKFPGCVAAPTNVTATAVSSSQVSLTWNAVAGAAGYIVERSSDGTTGWTQVGTPTSNSYNDVGLNPSTSYYYRVRSTSGANTSQPSSVVSATTSQGITQTQSPQGNWVGTYGADGYALLGWNGATDLVSLAPLASLDHAGGFEWSASTTAVQALQSPDTSTRHASCWASNPLLFHLNFSNAYTGMIHLYALDWDTHDRRENITVNDGSGPQTANITTDFSQGAWVHASINVPAGGTVAVTVTLTGGANAVLSGLFLGGATVPPAPANLTATAASSSSINLAWASSAGAAFYKIQRSPNGSSSWTQIGTSTTNSYVDSGLSASTTYYYRVIASGSGDSAPSNVASATTGANLTYTQSPQGNWVGTYGADGYALLGWNGSTDLVSLPQSSLTLDQGNRYQWSASTTAVQAPQSPDASTRRAACWFDNAQLRLHLTFPSSYTGTIHLYALDWDTHDRRESVTVNDGSGPRTANITTDFSQGAWVSTAITVPAGGTVTVTVTLTGGANAVLSGLFLG
jgi:hypothetical protein